MPFAADPFLFDAPAHERDLLDRLPDLLAGPAEAAGAGDQEARIPVAGLEALHDAGYDRAVLPEDLGGAGISYQTFGRIVEQIAEADASLATVWLMHIGAGVALAQQTADTLGTYYADALRRGDRFANALSEPASGNRFLNPQQEAEPTDGGYRLTGAKRFVSGSEIAQHLLVNVAIQGVPTFFGVEPDDTIRIIPIWDTLGLRATRSQLLEFRDTLLREDRRGVFSPAHFNAVGAGLPHISLGVANAALAALVTHAASRQILGRPLSHQEWLQHEVAAAEADLQAARAYARHALTLADAGDLAALSAFERAKLLANKVAVEVASLGVRAGGASGFLRSSPIQRHLRDAQAGQLMAYSTEVLAGTLGKSVLGVES